MLSNANLQGTLKVDESTARLKYALGACSFDRLYALYREVWQMVKLVSAGETRITDADLDTDRDMARSRMEEQLGKIPVDPFGAGYRKKIERQLISMGGIKICTVSGKGKGKSFLYTCGFTAVGGKELLFQNVHRSMVSDGQVEQMFNFMYKRHVDGHPLAHGHTIDGQDIVYHVQAPDRIEATLLKASKTLEATRLYGLAVYDVLDVIPVGVRSKDASEKRCTHEEVTALACGLDVDGYECQGNAAKLKVCAWCHKSEATLQTKLRKCSDCQDVYYCSAEHQKLDWKNHKSICKYPKEQSVLEYIKSIGEGLDLDAVAELFGKEAL